MLCRATCLRMAAATLCLLGAIERAPEAAGEDRIFIENAQQAAKPAGESKPLFGDQAWYQQQAGVQRQFTGTLSRQAAPQAAIGRFNPYRLKMKEGVREVYVGGKQEILADYVGKQVTITGKAVTLEVIGRNHQEIWPATIQLAAADANENEADAARPGKLIQPLARTALTVIRLEKPQQLALRSPQELASVFGEQGDAALARSLGRKSIDLQQEMVVVVAGGRKREGSHRCAVKEVRLDDRGVLHVYYTDHMLITGALLAQATYPGEVLVLPAHAGEVRFEKLPPPRRDPNFLPPSAPPRGGRDIPRPRLPQVPQRPVPLQPGLKQPINRLPLQVRPAKDKPVPLPQRAIRQIEQPAAAQPVDAVNGLALTVQAAKPAFAAGEPLVFKVNWKNVGQNPIHLEMTSSVFGREILDWSWEVENLTTKQRFNSVSNPRAFVGTRVQVIETTLQPNDADETDLKLPDAGKIFRLMKEHPLGDDRPQPPANFKNDKQLPPGMYQLKLLVNAQPDEAIIAQKKYYAGKFVRTADFSISKLPDAAAGKAAGPSLEKAAAELAHRFRPEAREAFRNPLLKLLTADSFTARVAPEGKRWVVVYTARLPEQRRQVIVRITVDDQGELVGPKTGFAILEFNATAPATR